MPIHPHLFRIWRHRFEKTWTIQRFVANPKAIDALSSMGWAWRGFGAITQPSPFQQAQCPDRKGSTYNNKEKSNFTH